MSEEAIERAEVLVGLGRPEEAATLLTGALAADPDDVELLVALAEAQLGYDEEAAFETAFEALVRDPECVPALVIAAASCFDRNRPKESAEYARRAVELAPWLATAHAMYGMAVGRRARGRKEGLAAAKRAIELAPGETVGYVAAGTVEMAHAEWKSAIKWLEKALQLDPHERIAQVNLVTAREAAGRLTPALVEAAAILRVDPRDEDARHALDETVYTTLVHLLWIAAALLVVLSLVLQGD